MGMPGPWELLLVLGGLVLIFGAKKLPALGGAVGESIKNFKKGVKETEADRLGESKDPSKDSTNKD